MQYTLTVSTLLSTIWTMNNYGTIYLLTSGGPLNATRVLGILTYERGFGARDYGSGVAISLAMLPLFGVIIWFLAAYMQAGTRSGDADAQSLQLRVLRPLLWPFKMVFNSLFDAFEAIGRLYQEATGSSKRTTKESSISGAKAAKRSADQALLLPSSWVLVGV